MLDVRTRIPHATGGPARGPRSRLELELREMADDLVGRLDRDELSRADEERITEAIDAAVAAALPEIVAVLDRELTPRLDALPSHTRRTLASARRRRDIGLD